MMFYYDVRLPEPRSYLINTDSGDYRRTRNNIIVSNQNAKKSCQPFNTTGTESDHVIPTTSLPTQTSSTHSDNAVVSIENNQYITKYSWAIKKPDRVGYVWVSMQLR